jgi:hypothetical protein
VQIPPSPFAAHSGDISHSSFNWHAVVSSSLFNYIVRIPFPATPSSFTSPASHRGCHPPTSLLHSRAIHISTTQVRLCPHWIDNHLRRIPTSTPTPPDFVTRRPVTLLEPPFVSELQSPTSRSRSLRSKHLYLARIPTSAKLPHGPDQPCVSGPANSQPIYKTSKCLPVMIQPTRSYFH